MAPAVPFALLGVVQLASVAGWLGIAAAACFPGLIRRTTPLVVIGALGMATADALTALRLEDTSSDPLAITRLAGLALLAIGLTDGALLRRSVIVPAISAPLGARPSWSLAGGAVGVLAGALAFVRGRRPGADRIVAGWIAVGLVLTGVAAALADPARTGTNAALAELSARAAATLAIAITVAYVARGSLLGKVVGAIVAGVTAMAVGAVAVVGIGVANQVQHAQSQRLVSVAQAQHKSLQSLQARAGLFAQLVAEGCPGAPQKCRRFLNQFAEYPFFAAIEQPGQGAEALAPTSHALSGTDLVQLAGSSIVHSALQPTATANTVSSGPLLIGSPSRLAIVAAVPGRPGGTSNAQVKPSFAAIYGIDVVDTYLRTVRRDVGYDVTLLADGRILASSLSQANRSEVLTAAADSRIDSAGPTQTQVVSSSGAAPTVAFVPVAAAGNDNVRVATLALSEPASSALAAQRSVLRRLVLTALGVLVVVALFAFAMAQRIADPVRRLTVAAGRVRAGDLDTTVPVESADEVGALARAFDQMTSSLRGLTGDLRDAAEEESKLRARLETVVSSMTDGLVTTDADGRVVAANPTAQQLLGRSEEELVGRLLGEAVEVVNAGGERMLGRRAATFSAEGVLRRTDGEEVPVRIARAPLTDQPGEVIVLSDRTSEREIERLKTEFLANISHELRTPLTPIRGYAEMLSRRPDLPKPQMQTFVSEILAGTARMSRAVELLVDVASLDAGRVAPASDRVVVKSLFDERLEVWRKRYPERSRDLRRRVTANVPAVEVDRSWLSKALDELVDNAVKYTPAGKAITVTAAPAGRGRVRLAVRDAGPGIETERLGELLGDFSQADASETRKVGGMGLGLGFVTRVARALGTSLEVASEPGRGAEFALDLPAAPPAPRRRTPSRAAPRVVADRLKK